MEDCSIEKLRAEIVDLFRRQIEALELETYVGLTHAEQREYDKRQDRIRDLEARMGKLSDPPTPNVSTAIKGYQ